jgi:hypothetical protein
MLACVTDSGLSGAENVSSRVAFNATLIGLAVSATVSLAIFIDKRVKSACLVVNEMVLPINFSPACPPNVELSVMTCSVLFARSADGVIVTDFKSLDTEVEMETSASATSEIPLSVLTEMALLKRMVIGLSVGTLTLLAGLNRLRPNVPTLMLSNSMVPAASSSLQEIRISRESNIHRIKDENKGDPG